jgi:hypothetical protein
MASTTMMAITKTKEEVALWSLARDKALRNVMPQEYAFVVTST